MNNFATYVQEFFSTYLPITRNLSKNTIETYSYSMLVFIKFLEFKNFNCNEMEITIITYELITEFITWLKNEKGNTPTTINLRIATLKTFCHFLELKNLSIYNECQKIKNIKMLKTQKHIPDYLTIKELQFLFNSINTKEKNKLKELAILSLLFDGGLRVSELCNIKISNLDINNNNSKIYIVNGKGNKDRVVLVSKDVANIINEYLKTRDLLNDDDYLFINKYGNKYTRYGISKIFEKNYNYAKQKCNDSTMFKCKCHPHMLRHSKGMQLAESGVNIIIIRNTLGHSSVTTTEIYARISLNKQDEILKENIKNKPVYKRRKKKEENSLEQWLLKNLPK